MTSYPNSPLKNIDWFLARIQMYHEAGFRRPYFVYETIRYMYGAYPSLSDAYFYEQMSSTEINNLQVRRTADLRLLASDLKIAINTIKAAPAIYGTLIPYFAIADEPHGQLDANGNYYPNSDNDLVRLTSTILREEIGSDFIPLGNLNSANDVKVFKDYLDIWLVNDGYNIDKSNLDLLKSYGKQVWIYNMGAHRLMSGFYIWRNDVAGYHQFAANSTTAYPYDPTDGREGDAALLYYGQGHDPVVRDVSAELFEFTEGVIDHRWCQWLDIQVSSGNAAAISIKSQLFDLIPVSSISTPNRLGYNNVTANDMNNWRQIIVNLAKTI